MSVPRLLVLTDRTQLPPGRGLVDTVARCAEGGLEAVVVRELDLSDLVRAELAGALAAHVRVIAARTRLPAAIGVHLHAAQLPLAPRDGELHGRSCHDVEEVWAAATTGAHYVTISPVSSTESKPGYGPPLGAEGLRAVTDRAGLPVLALGGVDAGNAARWREAGAHGVAVMGGVMRADDPASEVRMLLERLR